MDDVQVQVPDVGVTQLGLALARIRDERGVDPQACVARFASAW